MFPEMLKFGFVNCWMTVGEVHILWTVGKEGTMGITWILAEGFISHNGWGFGLGIYDVWMKERKGLILYMMYIHEISWMNCPMRLQLSWRKKSSFKPNGFGNGKKKPGRFQELKGGDVTTCFETEGLLL
mmetsp:Transcript_34903/g.72701  ORF Transcript_34903/g.72701 Transcript_34903/m.72701 type:complete len:129 (-) Transcript_34903:64-450(-)